MFNKSIMGSVGLAFVLAICIGLPLLWDIPGHWRLIGTLQNSGHSILFLVMAYCLAAHGAAAWKIIPGLLGVGIAIEWVQLTIGRDCDVWDVALDGIGISVGLCLHQASVTRSWVLLGTALVLLSSAFYIPALIALTYIKQWQVFPVLTDFEDLGRRYLLYRQDNADYAVVSEKMPWEQNTTQVLKISCPVENWPGVDLVDLAPNWLDFDLMHLDVWLYGNTPITLGLALRQPSNRTDHHDVTVRFPLQPGHNHLVWPLAEVLKGSQQRKYLLSNISELIVYCIPELSRAQQITLAIDNLRLSKQANIEAAAN
jgi:hypothetical protein